MRFDNIDCTRISALRTSSPIAHDFSAGARIGPHSYSHDLLIYVVSGTLELHTEVDVCRVVSQHAIWIPAQRIHSLLARYAVSVCHIPLASGACRSAGPDLPRTVAISALLRELILRAAAPPAKGSGAPTAELIQTLIQEEITRPVDSALPLPKDERLRRVCKAILDNPSDKRGLKEWADYAATSSRTLARLFDAQLGMSYQCWRQRVRVTSALPRLQAGESVTKVAFDLGYETPGAFSAMFKRIMRTCPSQYRDGDGALNAADSAEQTAARQPT